MQSKDDYYIFAFSSSGKGIFSNSSQAVVLPRANSSRSLPPCLQHSIYTLLHHLLHSFTVSTLFLLVRMQGAFISTSHYPSPLRVGSCQDPWPLNQQLLSHSYQVLPGQSQHNSKHQNGQCFSRPAKTEKQFSNPRNTKVFTASKTLAPLGASSKYYVPLLDSPQNATPEQFAFL